MIRSHGLGDKERLTDTAERCGRDNDVLPIVAEKVVLHGCHDRGVDRRAGRSAFATYQFGIADPQKVVASNVRPRPKCASSTLPVKVKFSNRVQPTKVATTNTAAFKADHGRDRQEPDLCHTRYPRGASQQMFEPISLARWS